MHLCGIHIHVYRYSNYTLSMVSCGTTLLILFLAERASCTDQELSCRDSTGCKNGQCRITSLNDVTKLKESLAANESPVKCSDPIGDKSFLQMYLQNRKAIEDMEAELGRVEKLTGRLESMLEDVNKTNELSFVGREEAVAELNRKMNDLETLQLNTSKEISDLKKTVRTREYVVNATEIAMNELQADTKKLNKAFLLTKLPCEFEIKEVCYWTKLGGRYSFREAVKVCERNRSTVANVPSRKVYDAIVESVRKKQISAKIWTGLTVEPGTWDVKPAGSFSRWKFSDEPLQGPRYTSYTNVFFHIFRFANVKPVQITGMVNVPPKWKMDGVVCQFSL